MKRDFSIDGLRGLAIILMVSANLAAVILIQPHPLWFRFLSSCAAPIFTFLAGAMVAKTMAEKKYPFSYYLRRGLILIGIGALIDVLVWQTLPFVSVDVLYFIGLSLPICALSGRSKWVAVGVVAALTPIAQRYFGYADYSLDWGLDIRHWLVDGFFPILPWLIFPLLGALTWNLSVVRRRAAASICLVVGGILWTMFPGEMAVRDGYSELFYPPTLGFCLTMIGLIFALREWKLFPPGFVFFGAHSLTVYVVHCVIIRYLWHPLFHNVSFISFAGVFVATLGLLAITVFSKRRIQAMMGKIL